MQVLAVVRLKKTTNVCITCHFDVVTGLVQIDAVVWQMMSLFENKDAHALGLCSDALVDHVDERISDGRIGRGASKVVYLSAHEHVRAVDFPTVQIALVSRVLKCQLLDEDLVDILLPLEASRWVPLQSVFHGNHQFPCI